MRNDSSAEQAAETARDSTVAPDHHEDPALRETSSRTGKAGGTCGEDDGWLWIATADPAFGLKS
jgi:hypothetical protein